MKAGRVLMTLLAVFCLVLIGCAAPQMAEADGYNRDAALSYALANYRNYGNNTCNVFVADCVNAGGIPISTGGRVEATRSQILPYGVEYPVTIYGGYYCRAADNPNCAIGDPVFIYCNTCGNYMHTWLIASLDSNGFYHYVQTSYSIGPDDANSLYWNYGGSDGAGSLCHHPFSQMSLSVINVEPQAPDTEAPVVRSGTILDASVNGYTVTCRATDNQNVAYLQIGTWNDVIGVDNAKWQKVAVSGKDVSRNFYIGIEEFGYQRNTVYHTNAYAIDNNGNPSESLRIADILIEDEKPVVTEALIENITPSSYEVVCRATDNGTVYKLRIGTWHDNMSVDNAVWQEGDPYASEIRFYVNASYFGGAQNVVYHTNVYAYDLCGNISNSVRAGNPMLETTAPVITKCETVNITEGGYDVIVTGTDNSCLSKLRIGTWHSGIDVDDAQWQEIGVVDQKSFTYTFHVDISDFGSAKDVTYYTNAYAYDVCRNVSAAVMTEPVPIMEPVYPDFILPSGTTTVEEYAFQGCAFTYVQLGDETTTLGNGAFADCPNLKHVYMPVKTVIIGSGVFPAGVTIHGKDGSYAEFYANKFGYPFVAEE